MNNKKILLLDCDEVIVYPKFVECVNDYLGTDYVIDDFTDYYIDTAVIPEDKLDDYNNYVRGINLYDGATIIPGAIDSLKRLSEYYEIYVLSSCVNLTDVEGSGRIFIDKYNFLLKEFSFLNPANFIFTGAKSLFKADVKIDDLVTNFKDDEDVKLKVLFPAYHNRNLTSEDLLKKGIIKAGDDWHHGWENVEKILMDYIN